MNMDMAVHAFQEIPENTLNCMSGFKYRTVYSANINLLPVPSHSSIPITHSLTYALTHPLTHSHTHSHMHSLNHPLTLSLKNTHTHVQPHNTHSLTKEHTHMYTHSLTTSQHSPTQCLTCQYWLVLWIGLCGVARLLRVGLCGVARLLRVGLLWRVARLLCRVRLLWRVGLLWRVRWCRLSGVRLSGVGGHSWGTRVWGGGRRGRVHVHNSCADV